MADLVVRVTVIDETPVRDPDVVDGDPDYLTQAVAAADDGRTGRPGNSATSPSQPRSRPTRARPSAGLFSFQEPDMPAYLTRFSCLLDVGTVANVVRAFDIYTALMADNAREDPPAEPFLLSLTPEHGATRLWLREPGTADPQLLFTFVTRCAKTFALTGTWGFSGPAPPLSLSSTAFPAALICWISAQAARLNG